METRRQLRRSTSRRRASRAFLSAAVVTGCLAGALAFAAAAPTRDTKHPAPLTIGALFSLTGVGGSYGREQLRAAQLAVEQVNAAGGIEGRSLRLAVIDDRSDPSHGKSAMRDLIEKRGVLAVLGPTLSAVAVPADAVASRRGTPVLAVSNTVSGIVGRCAHPCGSVWRDSLGESTAVPANIAQYVLAKHPSSAALMQASGDLLGQVDVELAERAFRSEHVRVLGTYFVPQEGSSRAAVHKALSRNPQALFIGTTSGPQAVDVIRDARAAGFGGGILGGNAFNSTAMARLAGRAGLGAQSGAAWYSGNDFPANAQFVTAYRQAYSAPPDQFAAQAYTGVEILTAAFRRAGLARAAASVAEQRTEVDKALAETALMTPLGPFRFTASHDVDQIVWVQTIAGHGSHALVGFCNPGC